MALEALSRTRAPLQGPAIALLIFLTSGEAALII